MVCSVSLRLTANSAKPFRALRIRYPHTTTEQHQRRRNPLDTIGVMLEFTDDPPNIKLMSERLALIANQQHQFDLHFTYAFIYDYHTGREFAIKYGLYAPKYMQLHAILKMQLADATKFQSFGLNERQPDPLQIVPLRENRVVNAYGQKLNIRPQIGLSHVSTRDAAEDVLRQLEMPQPTYIGPLVADGLVLMNRSAYTQTEFPFHGQRCVPRTQCSPLILLTYQTRIKKHDMTML
jgi:hypothetical protein